MPQGNETPIDDFVERSAMVFADWGFPRTAARVLMTLTASEAPEMTAAEIAERLAISSAAVSGGVRYLIQLRMIERRTVPGTRKDAYRLRDDQWYASTAAVGGVYVHLAGLADDGRKAFPEGSAAAERVAEMGDYYRFVAAEIESLNERWQVARAAR